MGIRVLAAGVIATDIRHGRDGVLARGSEIADEEARARQIFAALGDGYGTLPEDAIARLKPLYETDFGRLG